MDRKKDLLWFLGNVYGNYLYCDKIIATNITELVSRQHKLSRFVLRLLDRKEDSWFGKRIPFNSYGAIVLKSTSTNCNTCCDIAGEETTCIITLMKKWIQYDLN